MRTRRVLMAMDEGNAETPVIGQIVYGSEDDVKAIISAHKNTDSVFRAAMEGEPEAIKVHTKVLS